MANDIWVQRYQAIQTLQESYNYVESLAAQIKTSFDIVEDSVPERILGYSTALVKYSKLLNSLWPTLYNTDEYDFALTAETPKLILPPTMALDEDGNPYTLDTPSRTNTGDVLLDNEASVLANDARAPGFKEEAEVNIGWFGNMVNLLNNYIPETAPQWTMLWNLIRQGMGAMTRSSWWESSRLNMPLPIPEFVGHPDDVLPKEWEGNKGELLHDQTFVYGKSEVVFKLYKTHDIYLVEINVGAMSTTSSIHIARRSIGKCLVQDGLCSYLDNLRIPVLHRGVNGFEFGYWNILLNESNGILDLSVSGVTDLTVGELAANTTYTAAFIIKPDRSWHNAITEETPWGIKVSKKGQILVYDVEYLGRTHGPVPPPPPGGTITTENISTCVFDTIKANEFVVSKEPPKDPIIGGYYPLTYDNIGTAVFGKVISNKFELNDHEIGPTREDGDIVYYSSVGDNVIFKSISSKHFVTTKETPHPPTNNVNVPEVVRDYTYSFYFEQSKVCFSPTADSGMDIPTDYVPLKPVAIPMSGYVYDAERKKEEIDVQLVANVKGEIQAYGLYAKSGEKRYDYVYDFVNIHQAVRCEAPARWVKQADRFAFSIYVDNGLVVYEFQANYTINNLLTWDYGTFRILTEGEMPRNLCPTSHLIIPVGKFSYLIVQSNGGVRIVVGYTVTKDEEDNDILTAETIQEGVTFTGVWSMPVESSDGVVPSLGVTLPSMSGKLKLAPVNTSFKLLDDVVLYYTWPSMAISKFDLDTNNGTLFHFKYQLLNLRAPILMPTGAILNTDMSIQEMLSYKNKIRIKLGDGSVVRIQHIQTDELTGFSGSIKNGDYDMYFILCEFIWAWPQIQWIMKEANITKENLKYIIDNWDGIAKSEYFELMQSHMDNTNDEINYVQSLMEQIYAEVNGSEISDSSSSAIVTGYDNLNNLE
jgi:hypothetical protein